MMKRGAAEEGRLVLIDVAKRRGGRAHALPNAAGTKPGGVNTTTQIIKLISLNLSNKTF